jgi:hypothetical protein
MITRLQSSAVTQPMAQRANQAVKFGEKESRYKPTIRTGLLTLLATAATSYFSPLSQLTVSLPAESLGPVPTIHKPFKTLEGPGRFLAGAVNQVQREKFSTDEAYVQEREAYARGWSRGLTTFLLGGALTARGVVKMGEKGDD